MGLLGRGQSLPCQTERPLKKDSPTSTSPHIHLPISPHETASHSRLNSSPQCLSQHPRPSSQPRTLLKRGAQTVRKRGHLTTGRIETQTQEMNFFTPVYLRWSRGQVHTQHAKVRHRAIASASLPIPFTYAPTHFTDREAGPEASVTSVSLLTYQDFASSWLPKAKQGAQLLQSLVLSRTHPLSTSRSLCWGLSTPCSHRRVYGPAS